MASRFEGETDFREGKVEIEERKCGL